MGIDTEKKRIFKNRCIKFLLSKWGYTNNANIFSVFFNFSGILKILGNYKKHVSLKYL